MSLKFFLVSTFVSLLLHATSSFAISLTFEERFNECQTTPSKRQFACVTAPSKSNQGQCTYKAYRHVDQVLTEANRFLNNNASCPQNDVEHCSRQDPDLVVWWFLEEKSRIDFGCALQAKDNEFGDYILDLKLHEVTRGAFDAISAQVSKGGIVTKTPTNDNPANLAHSILDWVGDSGTLNFLLGNLGSSFLRFALSKETLQESQDIKRSYTTQLEFGVPFDIRAQSSIYLPGYSTNSLDTVGVRFSGTPYQGTDAQNRIIDPSKIMVSGFNAKWTDSTGSQIKTTPSNSAAPIALQIGPQIGCSSQRVELQVGVPQAVCTGSMNTETVSNKKRFIFWNKKEQNVTVSYFIATVVAQRAGQLLANEGFDDKAMSKISKNSNWEKSLSLYDLLDKALINQVHIVPSLGRPSILPSSQDAFIVFGINPNLLSKNLLKQKVEIQLSQDFQDGKNPPEVISRTIESLALNGLSTPKKVTKILKQESDNDVTYLIRLKSSPKEAVRVKLTINPGARDFDTELERQ